MIRALLILFAGFTQGEIEGLVLHRYRGCLDRGIHERARGPGMVKYSPDGKR